MRSVLFVVGLASIVAVGCSSGTKAPTDADYKTQVASGMHDSLLADLKALNQAAIDLQTAAPAPTGRGWDKAQDAQAIEAMKAAWGRARHSYELIEGAIAPLFPDVDYDIDARYDDFLTDTMGKDYDPFGGAGVTGMHAIERILWADTAPMFVVEFEKTIPGYKAAAFPATQQEAADFKNKLCAKLVADTKLLVDQWTPQKIDITGAFDGLIDLMIEQREKVNKASTSEEESRYSQRTMLDIRSNLEGTQKIYKLFVPYLTSKMEGSGIDQKINAGFTELGTLYGAVQGDAIPRPPTTWSAEKPSDADLATPFGKLWKGVHDKVDPASDASIVGQMNVAATTLGFPKAK